MSIDGGVAAGKGETLHEDRLRQLRDQVLDRRREGPRQGLQDPLQEVQPHHRGARRRRSGRPQRRAGGDGGFPGATSRRRRRRRGARRRPRRRRRGGLAPGGRSRAGRPADAAEVRAKFAAGEIDAETYAWREGFGDWLRLGSIDDFRDLGGARAAQPTKAPPGAPTRPTCSPPRRRSDDAGDAPAARSVRRRRRARGARRRRAAAAATSSAAAAAAACSARPAAAPAAARRRRTSSPGFARRAGGGDGGGGEPAADGARPMTGQRNENSVLFSLNNLQALASGGGGAPSGAAGRRRREPRPGFANSQTEGSGLIDIRAMAASTLAASPSAAVERQGRRCRRSPRRRCSRPMAAPILMPARAVGPAQVDLGGARRRRAGGGRHRGRRHPAADAQAGGRRWWRPAPAGGAGGRRAAPAAAAPAAAPGARPAPAAARPPSRRRAPTAKRRRKKKHARPRATASQGRPRRPRREGAAAAKAERRRRAAAPAAPRPRRRARSDELDDLLNSASPDKPARQARGARRAKSAAAAATTTCPISSTRARSSAACRKVKGKVAGCYDQFKVPGMANVVGDHRQERPGLERQRLGLVRRHAHRRLRRARRSSRPASRQFKGSPQTINYPFMLRDSAAAASTTSQPQRTSSASAAPRSKRPRALRARRRAARSRRARAVEAQRDRAILERAELGPAKQEARLALGPGPRPAVRRQQPRRRRLLDADLGLAELRQLGVASSKRRCAAALRAAQARDQIDRERARRHLVAGQPDRGRLEAGARGLPSTRQREPARHLARAALAQRRGLGVVELAVGVGVGALARRQRPGAAPYMTV